VSTRSGPQNTGGAALRALMNAHASAQSTALPHMSGRSCRNTDNAPSLLRQAHAGAAGAARAAAGGDTSTEKFSRHSAFVKTQHLPRPCRRTEALLAQLGRPLVGDIGRPPPGAQPLAFPTRYACGWGRQLRLCLRKNNTIYWCGICLGLRSCSELDCCSA